MTLDNAVRIAAQAHKGTKDKGGQPFIGHPMRVMALLAEMGFAEGVLEAAALHDVLEDTPMTAGQLMRDGVEPAVVGLVVLLTRGKGQTYHEYIRDIAQSGGSAIYIKLADLRDNMDPARAVSSTPSLMKRYTTAVHVLTNALREQAAEDDTYIPRWTKSVGSGA